MSSPKEIILQVIIFQVWEETESHHYLVQEEACKAQQDVVWVYFSGKKNYFKSSSEETFNKTKLSPKETFFKTHAKPNKMLCE